MLSPEEWDALPWWQQKMFYDGYEWEGLIERTGAPEDPTVTDVEVHHSGGTTITDTRSEQVLDHQPGEFAAYGIQEQTLG